MSDQRLLESLEAMERRLDGGDPAELSPEALEAWNREFQAEIATAERGPQWTSIVARAHALSGRIQAVVGDLSLRRDALKKELLSHAQGKRALSAYDPRG